VAAVERRESKVGVPAVGAVSVAAVRRTPVVGATRAGAVVDQVDVTEVAVVVAVSVRVATVGRVARARRARLHVRVAVGADHERVVISVVEPVVAAFTCRRR